jgi:Flp pilus assembly protein TadG
MVELVLSLSFLTALFLGTWEYGYTFYLYAELEQAVRTGARYASLQPYHSGNSTPTPDYVTAVKNVVVYGNPSPPQGALPVAANLGAKNVQLSVTFTNNVPTAVSVYLTGYSISTYLGTWPLNNKPLSWFPYAGMFGPP